jgi:hypothetical protein
MAVEYGRGSSPTGFGEGKDKDVSEALIVLDVSMHVVCSTSTSKALIAAAGCSQDSLLGYLAPLQVSGRPSGESLSRREPSRDFENDGR